MAQRSQPDAWRHGICATARVFDAHSETTSFPSAGALAVDESALRITEPRS